VIAPEMQFWRKDGISGNYRPEWWSQAVRVNLESSAKIPA